MRALKLPFSCREGLAFRLGSPCDEWNEVVQKPFFVVFGGFGADPCLPQWVFLVFGLQSRGPRMSQCDEVTGIPKDGSPKRCANETAPCPSQPQGVVKKKPLMDFLKRHTQPQGALALHIGAFYKAKAWCRTAARTSMGSS